jgi:hypothetical protein
MAGDGDHHPVSKKHMESLIRNGMTRTSGSKVQIFLRDQVKHPVLFSEMGRPGIRNTDQKELFPTPCAQDYKRRGKASRQKGLPDVIRPWPAPAARDYKDGTKSSCINVPVNSQAEGQLSAAWTEALMGYPRDWTDIEKDCVPENRFPKAWEDGAWESGMPRIITKQKYRRSRIEALGNSIVPQIPYLIFMTQEFDRWRKEQS